MLPMETQVGLVIIAWVVMFIVVGAIVGAEKVQKHKKHKK